MTLDLKELLSFRSRLHQAVEAVVVLEEETKVDLMLVALLCGGHVLLNDVPGVGKTLLAKTFARCLGLDFGRIQFTPDLLPSDVTGLNFYNQKISEFEFRPGPIFTHILLADEINRATPRTQASLLECMQEATVSMDGVTRNLPRPFMVIATQNPVEMEGTFPLPEAQLDRFLMCIELGYPSLEGEGEIIRRFLSEDPLEEVEPFLREDELEDMRQAVKTVGLSRPAMDYVLSVARRTRTLKGVRLGSSPRGSLYLARCAQAWAALQGRSFVLPDDVKAVAAPVLGHRLLPDVESSLHALDGAELVQEALAEVPVPVGDYEGMDT